MSSNEHIARWRPKARDRFADDRLVEARYRSGRIETYLYHEWICDLIDDAQANEIRVTLAKLASDITDSPRLEDGEWVASRVKILGCLHEVGLIEIDGEISAFGPVTIRLPERTYERWHVSPRKRRASQQPRGKRGRFAPKTPAPTVDNRSGSATVPAAAGNGTARHRTETETETEKKVATATSAHGAGVVVEKLPPSERTVPGQIRAAQRELQSHASNVILGMIGRRNSASDRMMTEHDELEKYWRPACELLAEHGRLRLREALNQSAGGSSMQYVATICGRLLDEAAEAASSATDATGSKWDQIMAEGRTEAAS